MNNIYRTCRIFLALLMGSARRSRMAPCFTARYLHISSDPCLLDPGDNMPGIQRAELRRNLTLARSLVGLPIPRTP